MLLAPLDHLSKQYYFYKLSHHALGDQITFEFENIDNNYTNGFMTKTGLFNLQTCAILPEKMFIHFENYKTKIEQKQYPYLKYLDILICISQSSQEIRLVS